MISASPPQAVVRAGQNFSTQGAVSKKTGQTDHFSLRNSLPHWRTIYREEKTRFSKNFPVCVTKTHGNLSPYEFLRLGMAGHFYSKPLTKGNPMRSTIRYQSQLLFRKSYKPNRGIRIRPVARMNLVFRPVNRFGAKPRLEIVP